MPDPWSSGGGGAARFSFRWRLLQLFSGSLIELSGCLRLFFDAKQRLDDVYAAAGDSDR
jgi:hypothetical protein